MRCSVCAFPFGFRRAINGECENFCRLKTPCTRDEPTADRFRFFLSPDFEVYVILNSVYVMNRADTIVPAVSTTRTQRNRYFAITSKVWHTFALHFETKWISNQFWFGFNFVFRCNWKKNFSDDFLTFKPFYVCSEWQALHKRSTPNILKYVGWTVCSWTRMLTDENSHLPKSFLRCETLAALNSMPSQRQHHAIQGTWREHGPRNRFSTVEKRNERIRDKRVWIFHRQWPLSLSPSLSLLPPHTLWMYLCSRKGLRVECTHCAAWM